MQLFAGESVIKTYTVAIGRGGLARKQRHGDHLTPEGLYQVDCRNKDGRFYRALHVSHPNEADHERARTLGVDPGGDIMIHGIRNGLGWLGSVQSMLDWTNGCIAVTDAEMDEVWNLVPHGTPDTSLNALEPSFPGRRSVRGKVIGYATMEKRKLNRTTRKIVNDALRARGRDESLRQGNGYFYFGAGKALNWLSTSVMAALIGLDVRTMAG